MSIPKHSTKGHQEVQVLKRSTHFRIDVTCMGGVRDVDMSNSLSLSQIVESLAY